MVSAVILIKKKTMRINFCSQSWLQQVVFIASAKTYYRNSQKSADEYCQLACCFEDGIQKLVPNT